MRRWSTSVKPNPERHFHAAFASGTYVRRKNTSAAAVCSPPARASFALYNTTADIDALVAGIGEAQRLFR